MLELFTGSQNTRIMMQRLEERVGLLEQNNALSSTLPPSTLCVGAPLTATADPGDLLDDSDTGPSPYRNDWKGVTKASAKRSVATAFIGEGTTLPGRTKYRKKLQLKIPETAPPPASGAGIPTPMLSVSHPCNLSLEFTDSSRLYKRHPLRPWRHHSPQRRVPRIPPAGSVPQTPTRRL
jgi:hypothetical protein